MAEPIGVGVMGASPGNSWAARAHIPALRTLPEFALRAVSTSRADSAAAARAEFGVPAYTDPAALLVDPGVDVVVISVRVPDHRELVEAAIAAGKAVYCEWPLGRDEAEARHLAWLADKAEARTAVGLQGRFSPVIEHVGALVEAGRIGAPRSVSLTASSGAWGPVTSSRRAYMFDADAGATTLAVPFVHALDAVMAIVGEIVMVTAVTAVSRPTVYLEDTGSQLAVSAPDVVAVVGTTAGRVVVSAHVVGDVAVQPALRCHLHGTDGDMVVSGSTGNLQVAALRVAVRGRDGELEPADVPDDRPGLGPASNVARLYSRLAADLRSGSRTVPDFADAVRRHMLVSAVQLAAESGVAQPL